MVSLVNPAEINRVQWDSAQQNRKAETHANGNNHRHVPWFWEGRDADCGITLRMIGRAGVLFHPFNDFFWKELAKLCRFKREEFTLVHVFVVAKRKSVRPSVGETGGHHL